MTPAARIATDAAGALILLLAGADLALEPLALARLAVLGGALGQLVLYDLREHRVPNRIVLPATALCAALSLADGPRLTASLLVGVALVVLLLAISLTRPEMLGMGDVKLALLILCGLDGAAPRALIFTVELYGLIGVLLLIRHGRKALGTSLPLAPIIAAASLTALLL